MDASARFDFQGVAQFLDHRFDLHRASGIPDRVDDELGLAEVNQLKPSIWQCLKLRQTDGLHSQVESKYTVPSSHIQTKN